MVVAAAVSLGLLCLRRPCLPGAHPLRMCLLDHPPSHSFSPHLSHSLNRPVTKYQPQVIALHDKYLNYVSTCFANSSLFHKALKEAFEGFCNKNVAGSTSAELMANFCDNILKKVKRALFSCYFWC